MFQDNAVKDTLRLLRGASSGTVGFVPLSFFSGEGAMFMPFSKIHEHSYMLTRSLKVGKPSVTIEKWNWDVVV